MPDALVPGRDRVSFAKLDEVLPLPDLVGIQRESFDWLLTEGIKEVLEEVSPIEDFTEKFQLFFGKHQFKDIKYSEEECKDKDMTYSAPLFVEAAFVNKETGEIKEQEVFMGDFPMMTDRGTFIINGTERVVVSQLVRSPGRLLQPGARQDVRQGRLHRQGHPVPRRLAGVRRRQAGHRRRPHRPQAPPERHGAAEGARLDRRRDPRAVRRRAVDPATLEKDHFETQEEALEDIYRKLRPGEPPTAESREDAAREPVLQPQALRPGPGRPVQGRQEARCGRRRAAAQLRRSSRRSAELDNPDKKGWEQFAVPRRRPQRRRTSTDRARPSTRASSPTRTS